MEVRVGKVGAVGMVRGGQARETRRWSGQDGKTRTGRVFGLM